VKSYTMPSQHAKNKLSTKGKLNLRLVQQIQPTHNAKQLANPSKAWLQSMHMQTPMPLATTGSAHNST